MAISLILFSFGGRLLATPPAGYSLVWSDEFNGPVGSSPNSANWNFCTGNASGWGNGELEDYSSGTANAQIVSDPNATDGSALALVATDPGGNNDQVGSYNSAKIFSKGLQSFQYGWIEARIRMPYGQGIWPAFWMLGDTSDMSQTSYGTNWPGCGEVDIMENIGKTPDQATAHGSLHMPGDDPTGTYTLGSGVFNTAYHTFSILWQPNQIQFYVDNVLYETDTQAQAAGVGGTWEFNQPFFLIFNVAVGGAWPGNPDGTTSFPQTMYVDYVRVYQQSSPMPTPTATSVLPTATPTATPSPSLTPTFTPKNTLTASATASSTQTSTSTSSWTSSATPTATDSPTASNTPTLTATETATASMTPSATVSSTLTATSSDTPTSSFTATASATPSPTASPTASFTPTPVFTATATATDSSTPSFTNTSTQTPTLTSSSSMTPTRTATPSNTSTGTFTPTASFTASWTASLTPTTSQTFTASYTFTPSLTPTLTLTPTPTATQVFTKTYTATRTATSVSAGGVTVLPPFPNPSNGSNLSFEVDTPGSLKMEWGVYTPAFRKIFEGTAEPTGKAVFHWDLRDRFGTPVANGLYYLRIRVGYSVWTYKVLVLR